MQASISKNNLNYFMKYIPRFLKNEHLFIYLLLSVFFIPWEYFGLEAFYSIKIKELTVIFFSFHLLLKCLITSKIVIDSAGISYLLFALLSFFYVGIDLLYHQKEFNFYTVLHIYLFVLLNFFIYLIVLNINITKLNLNVFMFIFQTVYLLIFLYFLNYAYEIHRISENSAGNFFTIEGDFWQSGQNIIYMGGTNGKSWFFLLLTSFLVGYYQSKDRYFFSLILILMAFLICSLLLTRSAVLFSFFLFLYWILSFGKIKIFTLFFILLTITLTSLYAGSMTSNVYKSMTEKGSQNVRINLVFESLEFASETIFLGRGFHYSGIDRDFFDHKKYPALRKNNTQNTYLAILIELGIIGVFLYLLIWLLIISSIIRARHVNPNNQWNHYLNGIKIMIFFLFFMGFFHHFIEKNFTFIPIIIVLIAIGMNWVKNNKTIKLNP